MKPICESLVQGQTETETTRFFTRLRPVQIFFSCPKHMQYQILGKSLERFSRFTRAVFTTRQTDRVLDFFQGWDLLRSSSRARNIFNTKFTKNRYEVFEIYESCIHGQTTRFFTNLKTTEYATNSIHNLSTRQHKIIRMFEWLFVKIFHFLSFYAAFK